MKWPKASRLSDQCEIITKGTTPTTLGLAFENKGVPFLRAQNLVDGSVSVEADPLYISPHTHQVLSRSQIVPEDVLISIAGTIGRASIVPGTVTSANCNQAVAIVRLGTKLNNRFFLHWLSSVDAIQQISKGKVTGTISNLSLNEISNLRVPLPPLDEQRRIAAILDKADALRRKRKRALDLLDSLPSSFFARNSAAESATLRLGDFATVSGGKRLPAGHDYSGECTEHKYLRVSDFQKTEVRRRDLKSLRSDTFDHIRRYIVKEDDLVISIAGTIGSILHINSELAGVNLTENAAKISIQDTTLVDPLFLAWSLNSKSCQSQMRTLTGQATIGKLALFRIEELKVCIPSIDEQVQFRSLLQNIELAKVPARVALAASERLFASLQHRAFSGQL